MKTSIVSALAWIVTLVLAIPSFAQGLTWTQKCPANSPQGGYYPGMAYDAGHSRMVLFGGVSPDFSTLFDETWTWDGSAWTKQSPATIPPARVHPGIAYDSAHNQVVMFGGCINNGVLGDTWVWDGANWAQESSGPQPPARCHMGMAYDAARQQTVLFGGGNGQTLLGDTWVWDGSSWTQKFPAHTPGTRNQLNVAYDAARAQVVLFGGSPDGSTYLNDTWVWDGTDWTQQFPVNSPSPRLDAGFAYDSNRQRLVLFSGIVHPSAPVDDITWEWDGTNWTQDSPASSPPARGGDAMAYDQARKQVVLFGGVDSSQVFTDTWVLGLPSSLSAQVQPPINADGSSVFDSKRGVVPVKFTLTMNGSPTCDLSPATISLLRTSGGTPGMINESDYIMPADTGSYFRISDCQYVYNLKTNSLGSGTYQVNISSGGTCPLGTALFGLK